MGCCLCRGARYLIRTPVAGSAATGTPARFGQVPAEGPLLLLGGGGAERPDETYVLSQAQDVGVRPSGRMSGTEGTAASSPAQAGRRQQTRGGDGREGPLGRRAGSLGGPLWAQGKASRGLIYVKGTWGPRREESGLTLHSVLAARFAGLKREVATKAEAQSRGSGSRWRDRERGAQRGAIPSPLVAGPAEGLRPGWGAAVEQGVAQGAPPSRPLEPEKRDAHTFQTALKSGKGVV